MRLCHSHIWSMLLFGASLCLSLAPTKEAIVPFGPRLKAHPVSALNQYGKVTSLTLNPDGNSLIISSLREGLPWQAQEDKLVPNLWEVPIPFDRNTQWEALPYGISSEAADLFPCFDQKGKTLFFLSWGLLWETTNGPIYRVRKRKDKWQQLKGLGGGITRFCQEAAIDITDFYFSPDGQHCYFAAQTPDGQRGDFFMSSRGLFSWQWPERMAISSLGRDISLSLSLDGSRMYLGAEKGAGYGKGDIYRLPILADGAIGPQENLGPPVNTPADEHHFVETPDGQHGYFIREGEVWRVCLQGNCTE